MQYDAKQIEVTGGYTGSRREGIKKELVDLSRRPRHDAMYKEHAQ
jgi:hypothetical protein